MSIIKNRGYIPASDEKAMEVMRKLTENGFDPVLTIERNRIGGDHVHIAYYATSREQELIMKMDII